MRGKILYTGFVAFLLLATASVLWAQLPTATLNGMVSDPQGAAVAGARVVVTNKATGVSREAFTGSEGLYAITSLAPGNYDLRVEAQGFAPQEFKGVLLEVGHAVTLDAHLALAKLGQQVVVSEAAAGVELTTSEVQGQVTATTVENIPLNGRNFLELAFLLPGNRTAVNFDPTKTQTLEVSSAGQFGRGGNISVDGADNNDEVVGGALANFPEDSIKEFQIATNRYTAEVGRSASSIINIVTKSGTNEYHGSAFFFIRSRKIQALPATFDRTPCINATVAHCEPPFDRQQYGGSVGGPFKKDRAWWFASVENRHQNAPVTVGVRDFTTNTVKPSSAGAPLRNVLLSSRVDFKLTDHDTLAGRYSFNRSTDVSNGSLQGPAFGSATNRQSSLNRFHSVLVNWTRTMGTGKVNSVIFHFDKFLNNIPAFSPNAATFNVSATGLGINPQGGNAEIDFPSLEDGATFRAPQQTPLDRWQVRDNFSWTRGTHTLHFGGEFQNFGAAILFDLYGSSSVFLGQDFATQDLNGDGVINDLDIPVAAVVVSTAPVRPPTAPTDRSSYIAFYAQDDWRIRPNLTINAGLRWEYDTDVFGEGPLHQACPTPLNVAPSVPCTWLRNALGLNRSRDPRDFSPRLGFAWDPFKNGKTVIRGGYGIYYDRVVLEPKLLELLVNGRRLALAGLSGSTCHNLAGAPVDCSVAGAKFDANSPTLLKPYIGSPGAIATGLNALDNNISHPLVQQWTFGIQHQLAPNWIISADGIHNFGTRFIMGRLLRNATPNPPLLACPVVNSPCTVTDPLTNISNTVVTIGSFAKTWYDGLLVGAQKRPSRILGREKWTYALNANYTLSKSLNFAQDDQIPFKAGQQADFVMGGNNLRLEKSYSSEDERHRFTLYGVLGLPWNFTVAPIWTYSSSVPGRPFLPEISARLPITSRNALARDITTGAQLNTAIDFWNTLPACPSPTTNTGPFPCHVGPILAHVNPNAAFGDSFNSFDLRVTKAFKIAERHRFELIAEAFNLFNVTNIRGFDLNNFFGFDTNITSSASTNLSTFNQPRNTAGGFFGAGGPRAFQFAVRYSF